MASCTVLPKEVIRKSTIKLEGKNTDIRNWIEINGYYPLPPPRYIPPNQGDWQGWRNIGSIMFFEDGTWVYFHFQTEVFEDTYKIQQNMSKCIEGWKNGKLVNWGNDWGVYKVENDTITVLSYDTNVFRQYYDERRYKVIDRQTIQEIYYQDLQKKFEIDNPWILNEPITFTPADSLPSSDCWLKKQKWIWRNEQDWRDYKERIKQEKSKKK